MSQDKVDALYDNLKEDGWVENSREHFRAFFLASGAQGYKNRKALYDNMKEDGYVDSPTYEEFARRMGMHSIQQKPSTPQPKPTQQPSATDYFKVRRGGKDFTIPRGEVAAAGGLYGWAKRNPGAPLRVYMHGRNADGSAFNGHVDLSEAHDRRKNRGYIYTTVSAPIGQGSVKAPTKKAVDNKGYRPSPWQMYQVQQQVATGNAQLRQQTDNAVKGMDAIKKGNRPDAGLGEVKINPKNGKWERQYTTVQGNETGSRMEQSQQNTAYNNEQGLLGELRLAYKERDELNRRAAERLSHIDNNSGLDDASVLSSILSSGDPMMGAMSATTSRQTQARLEDPEYQQYRNALKEINKRIQILENHRHVNNGGDHGFWRSFWQEVTTPNTWLSGYTGFLDANAKLSVNVNPGTKSAQSMMKAEADADEAENKYGDFGFWSRGGVMTADMLPFMVDFMMVGGAKGGSSMVSRNLTAALMKGSHKIAPKLTGKLIPKLFVKTLGAMPEEILRAGMMTNTVQAGKTAADIVDRKLGDVAVDENGNYGYTNDKTWSSAIWQGEANAIIENYSEMFGTHLDGIMPALAKTFGGKRISGLLARTNATGFGKILNTTRKQFERLGISDYFGEVGEEYYGQLWRTMLGLDDAYRQNADGTYKNLFFDGQFHGDIWGGMALSMGVMGAGKYTQSAIVYGAMRHAVNKADKLAQRVFAPEEWEQLRSEIDATTNDNIGAFAEKLLFDSTRTIQQRMAAMNYMERSLNLRGLNLAEIAKTRGATADEEGHERKDKLSVLYLQGLNASSAEEYEQYKKQKEIAESNLRNAVGGVDGLDADSFIDELDNNPYKVLDGITAPELLNAAQEYVNAKTIYEGTVQSERYQKDLAGTDSKEQHPIGRAVMKYQNRPVEVLSGRIVMMEDGTMVDNERSEASIVIRDLTTGKIEMVSPDAILSYEEYAPHTTEEAEPTPTEADDPAGDVQPPSQYTSGQIKIRNSDGTETRGVLTGYVDENGNHEYYVEGDLQRLHYASEHELDNILSEYVPDKPKEPEVEATTPTSGEEGSAVEGVGNSQYVGKSEGESLTLPRETNDLHGNRPEQNHDERTQPRENDGSGVAVDAAGGMEADRDRSDIRVYTQGLAASRDEHSEHSTRNRRRAESERLVGLAKANGQFLGSDQKQSLGDKHPKGTGESEVYIDRTSGIVYKVKDPYAKSPMKGAVEPEDTVYEHLVHNKYFPETRYRFEGISEDLGDARIVLSQKYVDSVGQPTKEQIETTLAEKGLLPEGKYTYGNDEVSVTDVTGDNALLGADGKVYFIDPIINFKKPVQEILGEQPAASAERTPTPLQRIPRDAAGEPIFEQAENPEHGWDALVEFAEGDAATAKEIADTMAEEKRKAYEKAQKQKPKGKTPTEILASKKAISAGLAQAEQEYNLWQQMANVEQRRQEAILAQQEAEARQRAAERAEAEKAEREAREEAARLEREALEGIPEWHLDTPENARKRGVRRFSGQMFTRQEPVQGVVGKEVEVKFSQKDLPKGHLAVIEAPQLQPSHIQGQRNPMFFIEEAQPKNRAEAVSMFAAKEMAEGIRPQEITSSATAYTGAPTVNTRGEVIQGNNRSDALRYLWDNRLPEQQQAYKQYLIDNAEQLGLDPEAVNAMQQPVLVNMLDVDDAEAIRLGQMTAQDTESGGIERIKPKNVAQKLGEDMRSFASQLLRSGDEEASFSQLVDRNGTEVMKWMAQKGAITDTQYQSAFDSKGNLTAEAKNDLQKVLYQAVFKGGSQQLEEMFDALPAKAQRAILSTAFRDMDSPFAGKMLPEIQASIAAYHQLMSDPTFAAAKKMEEVLRAIEAFKQQILLDDRFEQYMPADNFSNFALHLAAMYKANDLSQTTLTGYFNQMYDLAQGKKAATLFEEADTTEYPLADVIKKVLNIDYKPAKNGNNNVANGGADVALRNQVGQGGELRGHEPPASREQNPTGAEPSERGGGITGDSRGSGNIGNGGESQETTQQERLTKEAASGIIAEMEQRATVAPELELTIENWDAQFGENGIVSTPIGEVKMGENQFTKLMRQGRNGKLGMIRPTLEDPDIIIEDASEAKDNQTTERESSFVFVKTFTKPDGSRYYYFTSVTVSKDGHEVVVSNQEKRRNVLTNLLMKGKLVWKHADNVSPASDLADGLYSSQGNLSDPASEGTDAPQTNNVLSDRKVTNSASDKQENGAESSVQPADNKGAQTIQTAVEIASSEVNTAPTLAQVEAGNGYKIEPKPYTNKQGKTLDTYLVTFDRDFSKEELSALRAKAKALKGWYDRESKGWMLRSVDDAKAFAEEVATKSAVPVKTAATIDGELRAKLVEFALKFKDTGSRDIPSIERKMSEWLSGLTADELVELDAKALADICSEAGLDKGKAWAFRMSIDKATPRQLIAEVFELRNRRRKENDGAKLNAGDGEAPNEAAVRGTKTWEKLAGGKRTAGAAVVKGPKWEATGKPERFKFSTKKGDSHDVIWPGLSEGKRKNIGSTTAERDTIEWLIAEFGSPEQVWNAYESGKVFLGTNEAAIVKLIIEKRERNGYVEFSVGAESQTNEAVYDAAKGLLESAGIAVHEVSDAEARAMLDNRGGDERLMGSRTDRKMEQIAEHFADKQLDENQQAVVDVFSGKRDNVAIEVEREDGKKRVVMRQGREPMAGTKHSLFRHFGTASNYITGEDIAMIPEILAKGERTAYDKKVAYDYVAEDGTRLRVTTEVHGKNERFTNFISNRKNPLQKRAENTQLSAPRSEAEVSGAKVGNSGETAKYSIETDEDRRYLEAVECGDMELAQSMVNEAAKRAGYSDDSGYQGTSAFNGAAPFNGYGLSKDERRELWESRELEGDWTLGDDIDFMGEDSQLHFMLNNRNGYSSASPLQRTSISALRDAISSGKRKIKVYRSVPTDVKEGSLRDGDWVTPSKAYAEENAAIHGWGDNYRIIEQEVDFDELWWDGNDINEWGYDSGSNMSYRNTENNRKSLDAVTYDDKGNVIPLSQRFDSRKEDVRYMRTASGMVYGWTVDGEVWLNRDAMNPETPLHEYTHLWDEMVRRENPELWARGKDLMKETSLWQEVMDDPNYADIRDDEDAVASEVHSRLMGKRGAERMKSMIDDARKDGPIEVAKAVTLVERLKGWLREMFGKLKETLGKWSKRDLRELTAEQFADMTLRDLAEGVNPRSGDRALVAVHNISESKLKEALTLGGLPMPSIAVTKASTGHAEFGEISLVFGKESIDPSKRGNKVYGGDAWTPLFPEIGYKLDSVRVSEIYGRANRIGRGLPMFKAVDFHPGNLERRIGRGGEKDLLESLRNDYGVKQMFLLEQGNPVMEFEKRDVERYDAGKVRLFEDILKKVGTERLMNEGHDTLEPEVRSLIAEHLGVDFDNMKEFNAKARVRNAIRDSLDYALNGNISTENDIKATEAKIDGRIDGEAFESWLEETFSGIIEKRGIRNERDQFTPSGNSRRWESLYDAVTLDNVVKAMQRQAAKGGAGLFNSSIFGASTRELKDIEDIRKEAKARINSISSEEYEAEKDRIKARLNAVVIPSAKRDFASAMDFVENVTAAVAKTHTADGIYRQLNGIYSDMTPDAAREIADIVGDIENMATRYFEAKPQRAVSFGEVKLAVVPEGTSAEIVEQLERHGIQVRTYERGNERQRTALVSRATSELGLRFHAAMARGREDFDAMRERAVRERGIVMPGLNEAEVRVVDVPRHDFAGNRPIAEARKWAKENIVGEHTLIDSEGVEVPYTISRGAVDKYLSESSIGKSDNLGVHLSVLKALPDVIGNSIEAEVHPDYNKSSDGIRRPENGYNKANLVHRFYGFAAIEGKLYRVKITIIESGTNDIKTKPHSFEVTNIELLPESNSSKVEPTATDYQGQLPHGTAKLLKGVEKSYDPGKKLLDESEPGSEYGASPEGDIRFREVEDDAVLKEFAEGKTIKAYRTMQVIDGKLYSPMATKVGGKTTPEIKLGVPEQAEEHPEIIKRTKVGRDGVEVGYVVIDKGLGKGTLEVAYNPSIHASLTPLNDQFTSADIRPNLVIVETLIPKSELTSGYRAPMAKDAVGEMSWHSGTVSGKLAELGKPRRVILSRFDMPVRIVPFKEVAQMIAAQLEGTDIDIPYNVVTPQVRMELQHLGIAISDTPSGSVSENRDFGKAEYITDQEIERINAHQLEMAQTSPEAKSSHAEKLAKKFNTPIQVVTDPKELTSDNAERQARMRRSKGFYDPATGKVVVVLPNNANVEDVAETVFHEVVAHKGLREMLGDENYDAFCDEVYDHLKDDLKDEVDRETTRRFEREPEKGYEHHRRVAVDEMFGRMAEKGFEDFTKAERGIWAKLKAKVLEAINKFLGSLKLPKWVRLGDNELRYMLWRSHEKLRTKGDYVDMARDAVKREELGLTDEARFRDGETGDIWKDQSVGLQERITNAAIRLSNNQSGDLTLRNDAQKAVVNNLQSLLHSMRNRRGTTQSFVGADRKVEAGVVGAMNAQAMFDRATVKRVSDLARILMQNGYLSGMTSGEMQRLLSVVKNATAMHDIADSVQKIMDIMVNNQLRNAEGALRQLLSIRGSKVDARGVEVQGVLDVDGQRTMEVVKKAMSLSEDDITDRIAEALNRMGDPDQTIADQAALEYAGLNMALDYVQNIANSKAEEKTLRDSLKTAKEDRDAGRMTDDAYKQFVEATEDAIRKNKVERAEAYFNLVGRLSDSLRESIENAKAFREAEKARVSGIHHNANSDMEGRPTNEHHKDNWKDKFVNNGFVQFLFAPLGTFDQILRVFGNKSANGEGYLWNRFMRGWVDCRNKELTGVKEKFARLDEKAAELFGKGKTWGNLIRMEAKMPKATVSFWDGGEMRDHELTQGNLLYIYMVDKMTDGRMKLRRMGITEDDITRIENFLDPRFKALGDWLQDEFLVDTRNEYNETHKRMFGASMAAIENYFPLKILANARVDKEEDVNQQNRPDGITTKTGSIIKRRVNNLALDITGADALSVILDHITQMEHWSAYAEWNRDLNTLRTYKRFRNQVINMTTVYGGGRKLWENFNDLCLMAAGEYRPPVSKLNKSAVNLAKGVTAAKVSFRMYTALKQFLSAPAYAPEVSMRSILKSIANPYGDFKWCLENMPIFRERWHSRISGDPRLLKSDMDWKMWRSRIMEISSRIGMTPNAFVDAVTVSIGARAMYETRLKQYLKEGYPTDAAEKRAMQDATILFNQTQQSSESPFLSTMQVDKDWLSTLFTVFRNSAMSYTRQEFDAMRNLKRNLTPGQRAKRIEFMTKQILRDWDVDPDTATDAERDQAQGAAKKRFRRQIKKDVLRLATFGFILELAWNLGPYLPYMFFGNDEDEKDKMWDDAFTHAYFGSVEGLTGGDVMSSFGNMWASGEWNWNQLSKDMPLASDINAIGSKFVGGKNAEAINDILNLLVQMGVGMNPQSLTDTAIAITDACGDDLALSHEAAIFAMRVLQVPQSQVDKMYFDEVDLTGEEASKLTPAQLAQRYAEYKVKRGTPLAPWSWGDEERLGKYNELAKDRMQERLDAQGNARVIEAYADFEARYKAVSEKAKEAKALMKTDYAAAAQAHAMLQQDPDFGLYQRFGALDKQLGRISKMWLTSKTPEESALVASTITSYRAGMVKVLQAETVESQQSAMSELTTLMNDFYAKYQGMQPKQVNR